MQKKKFLNYINSFRGIAILYVVLGHCLSSFSWPEQSLGFSIIRSLFTNGTVLFLFIAGYLFQYLLYKYQFRIYLRSKLFNVCVPYLIMSVPAICYYTFFAQRPGMEYVNDWPWIFRVFEFYLNGAQLVPFWFIPMIFIHYLFSKIYVFFDKNNYLYYLLPGFILLSLFVWRGGPYQIQSYIHYASVYFFGMFCSKYRDAINVLASNGFSIFFLALLIVCFVFFEINASDGSISAKRLNFVQHIFHCIFFIGFLIRFDSFFGKRLDILASYSFGIFFIHSYLISIIKLGLVKYSGGLIPGTLLNLFIFFFFIVFLSTAFVHIVKLIFREKSRMICGS